jgi:hypothetical protein
MFWSTIYLKVWTQIIIIKDTDSAYDRLFGW